MVLLTITPAAKAAIDEYRKLRPELTGDSTGLTKAEIGDPIEHHELVEVSSYLVRQNQALDKVAKKWRLDNLMKGAVVYQPPPPPKPEPSSEYKALMQKLRQQEEQRQYERMLNPPPPRETIQQRFPSVASSFDNGPGDIDDVSYEDIKRQMILIINVLVSIIACSVGVWMAARRWSVPQRLGLSFSASTIVAVAEVAIYMGYLRRIKEAKTLEGKKIEKKEIVDTWIIDGKSTSSQASANESIRFRKGKHR